MAEKRRRKEAATIGRVFDHIFVKSVTRYRRGTSCRLPDTSGWFMWRWLAENASIISHLREIEPRMELMVSGLGANDLALFLNRLLLGIFFVSYRFRWVFDPSDPTGDYWFPLARRNRLVNRLCTCGYSNNPLLSATVAITEILAGLGLLVGLLSIPSAFGILAVMVFANCCTPFEEVPAMHPVDRIDIVACYLRLVEPLYLYMALVVILLGPGHWSMDYLILQHTGGWLW